MQFLRKRYEQVPLSIPAFDNRNVEEIIPNINKINIKFATYYLKNPRAEFGDLFEEYESYRILRFAGLNMPKVKLLGKNLIIQEARGEEAFKADIENVKFGLDLLIKDIGNIWKNYEFTVPKSQRRDSTLKMLSKLESHFDKDFLATIRSRLIAKPILPATLVHGDEHLGNLFLEKDSYQLIDPRDLVFGQPTDIFNTLIASYYIFQQQKHPEAEKIVWYIFDGLKAKFEEVFGMKLSQTELPETMLVNFMRAKAGFVNAKNKDLVSIKNCEKMINKILYENIFD